MSDLPQVQDWFYNLLPPSQWVFLWIVAAILIFVIFIYAFRDEADGALIGGAAVFSILLPLLIFLVLIGALSFVSFMIWLWSGAPG